MDISRKDFLKGLAALVVAPLAIVKGLEAAQAAPPPLRFADIVETKKRLDAHKVRMYTCRLGPAETITWTSDAGFDYHWTML